MSAAVGRHYRLEGWLAPFQILFTRPTCQRVLVLATGAILTTRRRTVAVALRVRDLERMQSSPGFTMFSAKADGPSWSLPGYS